MADKVDKSLILWDNTSEVNDFQGDGNMKNIGDVQLREERIDQLIGFMEKDFDISSAEIREDLASIIALPLNQRLNLMSEIRENYS